AICGEGNRCVIIALVRLAHLSLHNFRNYVRLDLDLPPGVMVLLGDNAQGKTNLLEAIYYLATSRSPYAGTDREMINWLSLEQEPLPYTRLVGRVARGESSVLLEITVSQRAENGSRYQKQVRLNGVNKRAMDLLGHLNVVLFVPEDVSLVSGSPGLRRRYLDVMLCQIDPHYCRTLAGYNQIVTQRNALLRDLGERGGDPGQLAFWNERLVEHGAHLIARRREAIAALDKLAQVIHGQLTDGLERLHLRYAPSVDLQQALAVAEIQAVYQAQLQSLRQRETAAGMTLAGPHRDEMRFVIDDIDAGVYGSRGQQRTAVLALKLAEVELMHSETGDYPVLLLDDMLSELDTRRRRFMLRQVDDGQQQAIITTTDLQALPPAFLQGCRLWRVEMGRLAEAS
ncbi:MAG: DNA replication/repair protein RecF, partial [Anaerolineae bacterium]|nr:DNA replication/repair protein RecF [Anaerolineae bacterium]